MTGTEQLADLVDCRAIELINIVAVPRSMSTALGRLLCQGSDRVLFVNEPFNRNNQDCEVAATGILQAASPHLDAQEQRPLTVITKNMATYLSDQSFGYLGDLAPATIWSVRNPSIQIGSLLLRMINDMEIETGASSIDQSEMDAYMDKVCGKLEDSELSKDFSRTGWSSISRHFKNRDQRKASLTIDGTELTNNPEPVLERLCTVVGLGYSPEMVHGWSKSYTNVNTGSSHFSTEENAWTRDAATTNGIVKNSRPPLDLTVLPASLRAHIIDTAMPAYELMIGHNLQ